MKPETATKSMFHTLSRAKEMRLVSTGRLMKYVANRPLQTVELILILGGVMDGAQYDS